MGSMKWLFVVLLIGSLAGDLVAAEKSKSSTRSLNAIPGVTEIVEAKLNAAGINNVNDLLAEGGSRQGREEIAQRSGLSVPQILKFVNYADLFRISGVGPQTAELLGEAGVDTLAELAQRNATTLHAKLLEASAAQKRKTKLPTEKQLAEWIEEAKSLPKIVSH